MIKKIGIITSGGDSPGMNSIIYSIVNIALLNNIKVYGIYDGFLGLYKNKIKKISYNDIYNIFNIGGTILRTSRFTKFYETKIQLKSIKNAYKNNLEILIIIGGNGSYIGAQKLTKMGLPCIFIPGTIDNDIIGTDYSIGHYTAIETIVSSIDKIRNTIRSHNKIFIIEIMGRNCGKLTLLSGIASGCEFIITPEKKFIVSNFIKQLQNEINQGKKNLIIAITENIYNIKKLTKLIIKKTKKDTKYNVLGYIQRGGNPIAFDRILGINIGKYAIKIILQNNKGRCIFIKKNKLIHKNILKT